MKKSFAALVAAGMIFAFANTASAHILVTPKQPITGTIEQYRFVAAPEKDSNFTKFRIEMPTRVKYLLVEPMAGWNIELEKSDAGLVKAVTWTSTAGGVKKGEFAEFSLIGQNSKEATTVEWKAHQTYADGSTDDWVGDQDSDHPAAITTMTAPAVAVDHHGNPLQPGQVDKDHDDDGAADTKNADAADADKKNTATPATDSKTDKNVKISMTLAGAALLAALASIVLVFRKRG